jgi:hypothetical protein
MVQQGQATDAARLARLREDIERWRRTRAKLGPMPGHLWAAAATLARRLGVHPVKSALGLNYAVLRSHVAGGDEVAASASSPPARFVELSGAQVLGVPAATGAVVEVSDAHGAQLTVHLVAGTVLDVARLVEAFRRPAA